ncbi:hypothetical protein OROMI_022143 [Orobanche minor]
MAEDVVVSPVTQDKASNACCAALMKKHSKLMERYSKLEELKNMFRNCATLVQEKFDVIATENGVLKKELEELKVQANIWKDEKENESGRCTDLEDEVSALNEEIQLLKQNQNSASQDAGKEIQQRIDAAEKEIKHLKELLDNERERATLEKKNAELEKKKADEALKKVEAVEKMVSEAQKVANTERKKAEENRFLWEKLKMEMESMLASERSKAEAPDKKVEAEKQKAISKRAELSEAKFEEQRELAKTNLKKAMLEKDRADDLSRKLEEARTTAGEALKKVEALEKKVSEAQEGANVERKKAEENRFLWEKLKMETESVLASEGSKTEATEKKVEAEKQNAIRERKRAELAEAKFEEQRELAETNLKKAMLEKDRADDLMRKLEEARIRAGEALKKVEAGEKKVSEAQEGANVERKKAEENRFLWEKLKMETESMLASERSKTEAIDKKVEAEKRNAIRERKRAELAEAKFEEQRELAETNLKKAMLEKDRADDLMQKLEEARIRAGEALKKVEAGEKKVIEAQKLAKVERKRAEENRFLWEKLKMEIESILASGRSKTKAADKKVEAEKQNVIRERKRAELAEAKFEEERELAEMNLKKAMMEKDRGDDLNQKLEKARTRAGKFEESDICLCSLGEAQAHKSRTGRTAELPNDACVGMLKNDTQLAKWMEKILTEKEQIICREKKRADSEKKKAKKQKKVAEAHKSLAMEQNDRANRLSEELESYKLRLKVVQKELQEFASHRICVDNAPLRNNEVISETDSVKLLKKRLKLEKMLVKHANEKAKVEALCTNMVHRELFHLKQECLWFQQRLDFLDKHSFHGLAGTHQLEKIGTQTSPRETLHSDVYHRPLVSGIDSRMDPPYRGSSQKILQSSAINSSSASFSDRTLVGSQERTFSVTPSNKLREDISNLNPTISGLCDKRRMRSDEHAVSGVRNSMRGPIKDDDNDKKVGYSGKKRILDALGTIENSYSKGEKLHRRVAEKLSFLHAILDDQMDEHEEILKENSSGKLVKPCKRRKTTSEEMIGIQRFEDSGELKNIPNSDIVHSHACMHTSSPGAYVMKSGCYKDGSSDKFGSNQCLPEDFDEMATYDYMKLLDLDDAADESSYRRAIAMPLSPMLPEVEIHGGDKLEVHNSEMLEKLPEGSIDVKYNSALVSSFYMIDMEKAPTNLVLDGLVPSQLQPMEDTADFSESTSHVLGSDTLVNQIHVADGKLGRSDLSGPGNKGSNIVSQIHVADGKLGMSDLSGPGNKGSNILYERGVASTNACPLRYFFVPSDHKDDPSILRILQTVGSCMPQCSFFHSTEIFIRSTLDALSAAADLSMKEKVCVFLSLVLHGIFEARIENSIDFSNYKLVKSFDLVKQHIRSALWDPVLRRMFMESCDLFELRAVIENFILHREVFVCGEVSGELEAIHSFKANLILQGNAILVSEIVASSQLLVAGGCLLASLCTAVDHIGFVCEMSCNIIIMQKFERPVMLAILHAFANVCGSKYFTLQRYSIAMIVVKSLVVFLEKQTSSNKSTSFCSTNCPFSEGALSMEDVASLLLETLQKHGRSKCWPQDLVVSRVCSHEGRTGEVSDSSEAVILSPTSFVDLCDFTDILSMLEILASFMSWDWTFDHIVGQLCEYVESHLMEGFSAAILVLLGQLGRLGVGACGYEDARVKKLKGRLSAFMCEKNFRKSHLSVQFAVVSSLFGLTPIKFEEIVDGKVFDDPAVASPSVPASSVREWFSGLSCEQQSLFRTHQAGNEEQS